MPLGSKWEAQKALAGASGWAGSLGSEPSTILVEVTPAPTLLFQCGTKVGSLGHGPCLPPAVPGLPAQLFACLSSLWVGRPPEGEGESTP